VKSKLPYILIALESDSHRDALVQEIEKQICYAAVEPVENKRKLLGVLEDCSWSDYPAMVILSATEDGVGAREAVNEILASFSEIKIIVMEESAGAGSSEYPGAVQVVQRPRGVFELEDVVSRIDKVLIEELHLC